MTELHSVQLKRHYAIDRHKLFELLSTPHYMQRWFFPAPDIQMQVVAQDFKTGGAYRFKYTMPDGEVHIVVGEYCTIDPPAMITFTWGWIEPDEHADVETLITLSLEEEAEGTTLSVLHEKLPAGEMLDRHEAGWLGTLENLHTVIAEAGEQARV